MVKLYTNVNDKSIDVLAKFFDKFLCMLTMKDLVKLIPLPCNSRAHMLYYPPVSELGSRGRETPPEESPGFTEQGNG